MNTQIALAFVGLVAALAGAGLSYVKQQGKKVKNDIAKKYFDMALETADIVVGEVNQTFVDEIRADNDGFITKEEGKEAFQKAFIKVKEIVGHEGMRYLQEAYGDVRALLTAAIEDSVEAHKKIE